MGSFRGCPAQATSVNFDCDAGYANWKAGWSKAKKRHCCKHVGHGCPESDKAPPIDCNTGYSTWQKKWSVGKKIWCCQHEGKGCPEMTGGSFQTGTNHMH